MANAITVVLSGPGDLRPQVMAALQQAGMDVEVSDQGRHGFEVDEKGQPKADGQAFITAHTSHPDEAVKAGEPFGWALRAHWSKTGEWRKVGGLEVADPMIEMKKLEARIRAAGVNI
jgi:hypothetical protein